MERFMLEVRRRANGVGAFPYGNFTLMLVAAKLWYVAGTKWSSKRYLIMKLLWMLEIEKQMKLLTTHTHSMRYNNQF